jgi:competence ComEA-like helix-hairpin-helix protein
MNKNFLIFLFISYFCLSFIFSKCSESQININNASLEELEKITQIGEVYANRIIEMRPFESLDDLIKVKGIAEKRLERIKEQNLACVEKLEIKDKGNEVKLVNYSYLKKENNLKENIDNKDNIQIKNVSVIMLNLNTKNIKTNLSEKEQGKSNYFVYGFIVFSFFIIILFILKNKKEGKNEFR